MKKYRLSTTISLRHHALLKKHMSKYETQQKVIEVALEELENGSKPARVLTKEDELWLLIGKAKTVCPVQKEGYKILLETLDFERFKEYIDRQKPLQYVLEVYYQKPLKELSLAEVIDALVINCAMSNQVDMINYTDDGDHYTVKMTHDLGLNNSRVLMVVHEDLFKTYGVRADYIKSDRSLFIKIYKNN